MLTSVVRSSSRVDGFGSVRVGAIEATGPAPIGARGSSRAGRLAAAPGFPARSETILNAARGNVVETIAAGVLRIRASMPALGALPH